MQIFTLHSMLDRSHQYNVFNTPPAGVRKIVISSAIAETSVTIDDVTRVIDLGFNKEAVYDDTIKATHLKRNWIAKANAIQRRGRAGRVKEGRVYRFYTKARFEKLLASYQIPEIKREALEGLLLRIYYMNLDITPKEVLKNCLDPPEEARVDKTINKLASMDAIIFPRAHPDKGQITPLGSLYNRFGVDPEISRMIFFSCIFGLFDTIGLVAGALSHKSPFIRVPEDKKLEARAVRKGFDSGSDLIAMAKAYHAWRNADSNNDWAYQHFLSQDSLKSMTRSMRDFESRLTSLGLNFHPTIRRNEGRAQTDRPIYPVCVISGALYPKVITEDKKHLVTGSKIKIGQESIYIEVNKNKKDNGKKKEKIPLTTFYDILRLDDSTEWIAFDLNYLNHTTLLMFGSHGVQKYDDDNGNETKLDFYGNEAMVFDIIESGEYLEKFSG